MVEIATLRDTVLAYVCKNIDILFYKEWVKLGKNCAGLHLNSITAIQEGLQDKYLQLRYCRYKTDHGIFWQFCHQNSITIFEHLDGFYSRFIFRLYKISKYLRENDCDDVTEYFIGNQVNVLTYYHLVIVSVKLHSLCMIIYNSYGFLTVVKYLIFCHSIFHVSLLS
jgi:hypothetical protein